MTIPPPCGLGNSQRRTAAGDALLDGRVVHRRILHHRRDDGAGAGDGELHHHAADQVRRFLHELLLVAELHLVDVAADDAADDLLVERAADLGRARDDVGSGSATTAEATGAAAVARAVAAAAALADGAQVAEADGAFAGAAAARPEPTRPRPPTPYASPICVPTRPPSTFSASVPSAESRPKIDARCEPSLALRMPSTPAFCAGFLGQQLGQVQVRVVLGTLEGVETGLVLGLFLPILPSSPL